MYKWPFHYLGQLNRKSILSLAEEAYHNQSGDIVERQLIYIFVDDLTNGGLKNENNWGSAKYTSRGNSHFYK